MKNPSSKRKFDNARKRLAESLNNLEEVIKQKLSEDEMESKIMASNGDMNSETKVVEQNILIKNLSQEINNLQKNFSEVGKENLFLHEKCKFLSNKVSNFRQQGSRVIQSIEQNINDIEELIKKHDN